MDLIPDESAPTTTKQQETLDFFEGYIVQAIEGLQKEKDQLKRMIYAEKMDKGLRLILEHRGHHAFNEAVKKYKLNDQFGIHFIL